MQELIFGILIGICVTNIAWGTVFYIYNKHTHKHNLVETLLNTLNAYSEKYAESGDTTLIPTIGRLKERIEKESGKKLKVVVEKDVAKYIL